MKITENLLALISLPPKQMTVSTSREPGVCGQNGARVLPSVVRWGSTLAPELASHVPHLVLGSEWKEKSAADRSAPNQVRLTSSSRPLKWKNCYANSICTWFRSPDCSLLCVMGNVNTECDACTCEEHTLLGSVRGAGGLTAEGTAILRSGKLLTVTDHNGHFRIAGICPDGNTTLTFILKGHSPLSATVPRSGERVSVLSVQLKRTGTRTDGIYADRRTTSQSNFVILFVFQRSCMC